MWSFVWIALLWIALGAIVGVTGMVRNSPVQHWTALHMLLLGGVSQLVLGASQFFAGAFLATGPPRRTLIRAQIITWNTGTVFVVIGVPHGLRPAAIAGASCIVLALALFARGLYGLRRRSLQRVPWAVRWYLASAACLVIGVLVGAMMTWPTPWQWGNLLGAHLALNLGGWLGTAIIGTQHTFFPSLTRTRLRWRRLQLPTFVTWMLGIAALAAGEAFTLQPVVLLGWVLLTTANVLLGCNLAASWRTGSPPRSLPARLLASAHCLGLAGLLLGTVHAATSPAATSPVSAVVVLLLVGWIGLTVAGALMHLLAVVARIRGFATQLPQGLPIRDRALTLAATTAIIAWATGCEISVTRLASVGEMMSATIAILLAMILASRAARAAGIGA